MYKIHYDTPKCQKAYLCPGERGVSVTKQNIYISKLCSVIYVLNKNSVENQMGIVCYEQFQSHQRINVECYKQQVINQFEQRIEIKTSKIKKDRTRLFSNVVMFPHKLQDLSIKL